MLSMLHVKMSGWINKLDLTPARQVWHNFRDTRLTHQRSYLARLNYVHQNPSRHGLVPVSNQYPWCSARWFERTASPAIVKSIYRFKIDQVAVEDNFQPHPEW
jgi:putative transposase